MNNKDFIYLDWNSTTPMETSVIKAMQESYSIFGNSSSIHLEGRKARKVIEESRNAIATYLNVGSGKIIFTSGSTESAQIMLQNKKCVSAKIEHPSVSRWTESSLKIDKSCQVDVINPNASTVQLANSETGIVQKDTLGLWLTDATQYFPKKHFDFDEIQVSNAILSPHKFGGPKGVGAILVAGDVDLDFVKFKDAQEDGVRPGTQNITGIVGFAESVRVAKILQSDGVWQKIEELKKLLEVEIKLRSPQSIIIGESVDRLPNTSCILTPGWGGEKQVIALDLAGFGVSFGSACSQSVSKSSDSITSLGFSEESAKCALRVSLGPSTTISHIEKFIECWSRNLTKQNLNAA